MFNGKGSSPEHLKGPLLEDVKADGVQQFQPNRAVGLLLTGAVALTMLSTTVVTSFASNASVPNYTQNFIRCLAAAVTLRIATLCRGEAVGLNKEQVKPCMDFAIADWFFLWGYVKALIGVTVLQFASMTNAIGPLIAAILGCLFLGEGIGAYKIFALFRNVALALLIVNPFDGASSAAQLLVGAWWVCVAGLGTGFTRIVQRSTDSVPGTVLTFWGYVVNTLLWLPPGCTPPKLRIPVLWPHVPQDAHNILKTPMDVWIVMTLSGVFGAAVMVIQGYALKHLDVATYSMLVTPLSLVLTTLYSAAQEAPDPMTMVGVVLQVLAMLADMYLDKRQHT